MKKIIITIFVLMLWGCSYSQDIRIDQIRRLPDTLAYILNNATYDSTHWQSMLADSLGRFWDSVQVADAIRDTADRLDGRVDSVIANLGGGGVDTLTQDIIILNYAQYSTPEQYLIYQSDTTVAIQRCLDSVGTRIVYFGGQYTITDSIKCDLNNGEMVILFAKDAKITSNFTAKTTDYYNPTGEIIFISGKRLEISGGTLYGETSTSNGFQSILCIRDVNQIRLQNLTVRRGKYAGVRIMNALNFTADNCHMDSSHYANLYVSNTKQSNINGGEYSYAGYDVVANPDTGYGITFTGRYVYPPGSSGNFNNENITVSGVKAYYNTRKGIDSHGGQNITFSDNKVKGFGSCGIYAVNEDGEGSYEKHVRNVIISNNIITQDSTWLEGLLGDRTTYYLTQGRTLLDSLYWWSAIQSGDYQGSVTSQMYPPGVFTINGNVLDSMQARGSRAPLFIFVATTKLVGYPRYQIEAINVLNNTILYPNVSTDEFNGEQDAVIFFSPGTIPPKFVNVSGNNILRDTLQGTANNGIKLSFTNPGSWNLIETNDSLYNQVVNVNENNIQGYFNYPLFISSNNIKQVTFNNTYNGKKLADMDDAYSGIKTILLHAVASGDSITLVDSVSISANTTGHVFYDIEILQTNDVTHAINKYHFMALAYDTVTTTTNPIITSVTQMSEQGIGGYEDDYRPTIQWYVSDGTYRKNVGTLKLIDSAEDGYSKYKIDMKIVSRNVPYWRTE